MDSGEQSHTAAAETARIKDEDAELVERVQAGDIERFEELVNRHSRRIYRTLLGITGNHEDAEDGVQNAFLKAFLHINDFQSAARFSTWLMRIAINEGMERLRRRKNFESLDQEESEEGFRPRLVLSWHETPEQLYSKAQVRELVEKELVKLPAKYRVVVVLRDLEQLSTEEAAESLGLAPAALKSRLLRGRLMLREALAPYFVRRRQEGASA